jgi:peptidoglycan/xylan/chitin deacetylase (PgdA/CDA1 family)
MTTQKATSRRQFLLGAAALVGESLVATSCAQHVRASNARRVTVPTLPPPASTPPIASRQPLEELVPPLPSWFRSGPPTRASVGLTVDDLFSPADADALALLLDVGKAKNVHFSFFPTGGALRTHLSAGKQDVWRRAVAEGHEVGNHTYTHRPLTSLSDDDIRGEIGRTEEALDAVLGSASRYRMRLLRPPGGAGGFVNGGDPRIMSVIASMGYSMAMWSIDSNGTTGNASYLAKIMANATNGTIVLTHFTTLAEPNFAGLIDRLRNERHLEPTNITGLFT